MSKKTLLSVIYLGTFVYIVNCEPCSEAESLDITQGILYPNGSVIFNDIEYSNAAWYEKITDGIVYKFGCPCIGRKCLRKCCKEGAAYFGRECLMTDDPDLHPFNPQLHNVNNPVTTQAKDTFFFMYNPPCEDRYLLNTSQRGVEMYIQEDGRLYEITNNRHQWHQPDMFCVDMMMEPNPHLVAVVCFYDEDTSGDSPVLYIAYSIGLLISVPFLLATFLVYAFIPELRNLHGLCLMSYCAGLIVAYVFLTYLKLHTGKIGVAMTGCLVIAFMVYYFFQSSFFWLNVMCFDIWRTFSGYRGGVKSRKREFQRFGMYALYAWGMPLVLVAITVAMQLNDDLPDHIIRPMLGERRCWFENWHGELIYFYAPVLILVVVNTVLFGVTANRIRMIHRETAILKSSESARSDRLKKDKQRYGLYLKLFIMMGVNWGIEVISFAVGGSNWYWVITDMSNIALGIFIFIFFVWKNKARTLLMNKLRKKRGVRSGTDFGGTGRWTSSSAPTEDTRLSSEENGVRLKDMH